MRNNSLLLLIVSYFLTIHLKAETKHYLVYLTDKSKNDYNIERPWEFLSIDAIDRRNKYGIEIEELDLPVSENYIQQLKFISGVKYLHSSKWLNAVHIALEDSTPIQSIKKQSFVVKIEYLGTYDSKKNKDIKTIPELYFQKSKDLQTLKRKFKLSSLSPDSFNNSQNQNMVIGIPLVHQTGYAGKGIHIAVFDAGFHNAYQTPGMEDLIEKSTFVRDFVDEDNSVWEDDKHGANVLSFMKTFQPGKYIGTAPFARYSLMRTEIADAELPLEELNWLLAAESADSLGVDMIIGSLGYHTFDESELNHKHADLNGITSIAAQAANIAHNKGIAVICSAGNEGNKKWRKIGTPADALGALAIGSSDLSGMHSNFSSEGLSADGRIKPNFTVPGFAVTVSSPNGFYKGNGTSYAAPIFAGAMACLMEYRPNFHPDSLLNYILFSSTHQNYPDSLYGYGIPNFGLALYRMGAWINTVREDYFWNETESIIFFQDINLYLLSYSNQKITIDIQGFRKKKFKTFHKVNCNLKAGQWLHNDFLFNYLNTKMSDTNKLKYKKIKVIIQTESKTFIKIFAFNS
jgi:serine protease AprX